MKKLEDYIKENFKSKSAFAIAYGYQRQNINKMILDGVIVSDDRLYVPVAGEFLVCDGIGYREIIARQKKNKK